MKQIILFILLTVFLTGCVKEYPVSLNNTHTKECPTFCDDGNTCTKDVCSEATNFTCSATLIVPCCGDGICDENKGETHSSCSQDCIYTFSRLSDLDSWMSKSLTTKMTPLAEDTIMILIGTSQGTMTAKDASTYVYDSLNDCKALSNEINATVVPEGKQTELLSHYKKATEYMCIALTYIKESLEISDLEKLELANSYLSRATDELEKIGEFKERNLIY